MLYRTKEVEHSSRGILGGRGCHIGQNGADETAGFPTRPSGKRDVGETDGRWVGRYIEVGLLNSGIRRCKSESQLFVGLFFIGGVRAGAIASQKRMDPAAKSP